MKVPALLCFALLISLTARASAETVVVEKSGIFCNFVRWTCLYTKVIIVERNEPGESTGVKMTTTSDPAVDSTKAK